MTKFQVTRLALCFGVCSLLIGSIGAMFRRKPANAPQLQAKESRWDFTFDADVRRNSQVLLPELLVVGLEYIECEGMKTEGIFRQPKSFKEVKETLERYGKHVNPPEDAGSPSNAVASPANRPGGDRFALAPSFHVLNAGTMLKLYFNHFKEPLFPNEMLWKIIKFGLQLSNDVLLISNNRPKPPGKFEFREKKLVEHKTKEKAKFEAELRSLLGKIHTEFPKHLPGIRMNIEQTADMRSLPKLTNERIRAFRHLAQTAFLVVESSQFTKINFPSLGTLWSATLFHVDDVHLRKMELLGRTEEDNGMATMGTPLTHLYQDTVVKAITAELFRYFDVLFDPLPGHVTNEPADVVPWCRTGSALMHMDNGRWRVNHPVENRVNFKQDDER